MQQRFALLLLVAALTATDAFMPSQQHRATLAFTSSLQMAGFGAAGGGKKEQKLKPKAQWGRYKDLKKEESVRVAVRVINDDAEQNKWYQVGAIKSKDNAHTEAAVVRHRVLISEHARRIFPLQISSKDRLEWSYCSSTATHDADWVRVSTTDSSMPDGIEKMSGFEGAADPTGFYARSNDKLGYIAVPGSEGAKTKGTK